MKLAIISWEDSQGPPTTTDLATPVWTTEEELKSLIKQSVKCLSVGMVYDDSGDTITLVPTMAFGGEHQNQYAGWITIPKNAIVEISEVGDWDSDKPNKQEPPRKRGTRKKK